MRRRYETDGKYYVQINIVLTKGVSPKKIEKIRTIIQEAYEKIAIQTNVFRKPNNEIPEITNDR